MKHTAKQNAPAGMLIPYAITLLPLAAGLSLWTNAAFPSLGLHVVLYAGVLFACSFCFAFLNRTKAGVVLSVAAAVACVIAVIVKHDSFLVLFNDFFVAVQQVTGHIYLPTDDVGDALWAVRGCMLLGGAIFLGRAAYSGNPLWLVWILVSMLEGAFSGVVPLNWGMALFIVGVLLLPWQKGTHRRASVARLAVVLVCALAATGVGFALRSVPQDGARAAIGDAFHRVFYHHDATATPEGRLDKTKPFETDGTPALKVKTEKPREMYLRGSLYEYYTGSSWTNVPALKRADYGELFCWLHDNGFFGQTQIGFAGTLKDGAQTSEITIETLSACKSHGYLPYGAVDTAALDETLIGDATIPHADGTYVCVPDDLATLYALPHVVSEAGSEEYTQMEQSYAEYVRRMDLQIPQDVVDTLAPLLGAPDRFKTLSEIEDAVRDALDKAMVYDASAGAPAGNGDFLARTLRTGRGYSVHYATAAVLMLRYFGVPARYVEGYYLPQDVVQAETIVTKVHSHAWAELYLNGVGFVPFEVTPGYWNDRTPEPDGEQKAARGTVSPQVQDAATPPAASSVEEESPQAVRSYTWVWLLLIPLAAALYVLIGRLRLRRAMERIRRADNRSAVRTLYVYSEKLRRICPVATHGAAPAEKLYLEARYSDHAISDRQRGRMLHYVHSLQRRCKKHLPFYKKFFYRFIRFFY